MNTVPAGTDTPCRLCSHRHFSEDEMKAQIDQYLSSLPEEVTVPGDVYISRLEQCYRCHRQISGMCVLCGCYVRVRAAKRTQTCPDVGREKWLRMGESI